MTGTSRTTVDDPSHPFYLDESDCPGMRLVNTVFDGSNFGFWKWLVQLGLKAKNKLGFIDGSCPMPNAESPLLVAWTMCNATVMSWILNSLSNEIAEHLIYSTTAKEMWDNLEVRFEEPYGVKCFRLYKELVGLKQGSNDIAGYFTKFTSVWNELHSLNTYTTECKCDAKLQFYKAEKDKKLIQFLIGLNECYIKVRERILMMSPLPSVNQACALLRQEESLRKVQSGT